MDNPQNLLPEALRSLLILVGMCPLQEWMFEVKPGHSCDEVCKDRCDSADCNCMPKRNLIKQVVHMISDTNSGAARVMTWILVATISALRKEPKFQNPSGSGMGPNPYFTLPSSARASIDPNSSPSWASFFRKNTIAFHKQTWSKNAERFPTRFQALNLCSFDVDFNLVYSRKG